MDYRVIIASIVVMILLGVICKKIKLLKEDDVETLNNIVTNIALPCMIFNALYSADVSLIPSLSILTVHMLITSLIIGVLTYSLLKFLRWDEKVIWTLLIVVVLGNTGFLGYPITQGIFGLDGLLRAAFCDISTSVLFVILSFLLIVKFDGSIKVAVKRIFFFAPLWAIILGILFNVFNIPITSVGSTVVDYLAGATIPLIMISLGLSLNFGGLKDHFKEVSFAVVTKLIVYPLVGLGVLLLLHITGFNHTIGFLETAMSSAMLGLVLAVSYDLDVELASDCIFTSTILSLITIPIYLTFIL